MEDILLKKKLEIIQTFKVKRTRKRPEVLYYYNGCWLVPSGGNADPYSISIIKAEGNNEIEAHFLPKDHLVVINEKRFKYDANLSAMLDVLVDFSKSNDFSAVQIAGLLSDEAITALKNYGFSVSCATSLGEYACCYLWL